MVGRDSVELSLSATEQKRIADAEGEAEHSNPVEPSVSRLELC
jgi:hypothetical protein